MVLTTMAETLNRLDMSLTWWQLRLMQLFLYLGPAIATLAGWAFVAGLTLAQQFESTINKLKRVDVTWS